MAQDGPLQMTTDKDKAEESWTCCTMMRLVSCPTPLSFAGRPFAFVLAPPPLLPPLPAARLAIAGRICYTSVPSLSRKVPARPRSKVLPADIHPSTFFRLCFTRPPAPLVVPLYAAAFSNHPSHPRRMATGSFLSSSLNNKIHIIDPVRSSRSRSRYDDGNDDDDDDHSGEGGSQGPDFELRAVASHPYPVTKLAFEPIAGGGGGGESSSAGASRPGRGAAGRMSTSTTSSGSTSSSSSSGGSSSTGTTDSSRSSSSSSDGATAAGGGRVGSLGYEQSGRSRELLASAADVLRIWEITERDDDGSDNEDGDGHDGFLTSTAEDERRRQAASYVGASRGAGRPTCRIRERSRLTNVSIANGVLVDSRVVC